MARVLARLRISRQTEKSSSIQRQRDDLKAWAKKNGHVIVGWATDLDLSRSADPFKAPKLGGWLTGVKTFEWDILAATRVDRLAAGWRLSKLMVWIKENNKDLVALNVQFPLSNEFGWMFFTALADHAIKEWETIRDRNRSGHANIKRQGWYKGGPYPYWTVPVRVGKHPTLALDPETSEVTRRIIREYLDHRPLKAIAEGLNADGILAPWDRLRVRAGKEPKGTKWSAFALRSMLANPALYGAKVERVEKPLRFEVIRDENGAPVQAGGALITPGEFEEILRETARRKSMRAPRRENKTGNLLQVVFCRECGGPLYHDTRKYVNKKGESYRKEYYRFRCQHGKRVHADELDEVVHGEFISVVGRYPRLQPVYVPAEDHSAELEQARESYRSLATRFASATSESIRKILGDQMEALEGRIAELEAMPSSEARVEYQETGETFASIWAGLDAHGRRKLMLETGVRALVSKSEGEARVDMVFPEGFLSRLGIPDGGGWAAFSGTVPEHLREYED